MYLVFVIFLCIHAKCFLTLRFEANLYLHLLHSDIHMFHDALLVSSLLIFSFSLNMVLGVPRSRRL